MHFNAPLLHGFEVHLVEPDWRQYDRQSPHGPLPPGIEVLGPWRPFQDPARVWLNAFYRPFPRHEEEMPSRWYADRAIDFMRAHRSEPWFVQIGFPEPHSPFWFP